MGNLVSISGSSTLISTDPPATVRAPEIEPGVGCNFDSYLLVPDNTLDDRIAAAKVRLGEDVVILGHHYQRDEVIKFADFRGDSLKLSFQASETYSRYIVFCGVHFMAESADILRRQHQIGVHVADGNDLAGIHNRGEFIPAGLHLANISHVGHRAASVQVRQHYNLVLTAENVRAFRHEMDATEDDVAGVGFGGLKREFQGVAAKISEFDDFVALVVMAEDDHVFAQADFSCGNAVVEGVIGNEQVGVKVAADTRLDFRRANRGRRIRADEGAASRNGNEVAHGWYSLYLERWFSCGP